MSNGLKDYITYHFFNTRICPNCRKEVDYRFNYCPYCGFKLRQIQNREPRIENLTPQELKQVLKICLMAGIPTTPVILNLVFGVKDPLMLLILTLTLCIPVGYIVVMILVLIALAIHVLTQRKPVKRNREAIRR